MIKLKAFLLSLVLVIATLALLNVTYVKKIEDYYKVKDNSIRYSTSYEKYKSRDILTSNITPNTLVLMGSSELVATINEDYHPNKTNVLGVILLVRISLLLYFSYEVL